MIFKILFKGVASFLNDVQFKITEYIVSLVVVTHLLFKRFLCFYCYLFGSIYSKLELFIQQNIAQQKKFGQFLARYKIFLNKSSNDKLKVKFPSVGSCLKLR